MRSIRTASHGILAVVLGQQVLLTDAAWSDRAWVRKYPCPGSAPLQIDGLAAKPFRLDSFRGTWTNLGDSARLEVDMLAVNILHLVSCQDIDTLALEDSLEFESLGHPAGQLKHFRADCPLPITDDLTP